MKKEMLVPYDFKTYFMITIGAIIQGLAMDIFLFPNNIPSGGAGGIAVLMNYLFHIPIGVALWLANFSMLLAGIKWLGNSSVIGTMYSISVAAITIQVFDLPIPTLPNVWIDLFVGSLILGIGVGILLRQEVSNGGVGVIALIVAKYRNTTPGKPLFLINGLIFLLTASIISWEIIFQAIFSQWLSSKIVDMIFEFDFNPNVVVIQSVTIRKK
ncbi:YitT family protein [Tepidibacillus fermentans]|uniref:Putative 5xTM membrane YitT family protein n=1 Tax=Tepidibacillus fermentans TaxID=1281767 RepID=A0A4R3KI72_9BACI|nr:YitT family protein [Tepidibacillus fermentans]TCS83195.1 putative 5xTM membrane YitT family protein [Tepidibacillus fermentans]